MNAMAHYHLPGLFEFYDLYRAFLPLYRAHREYFYDWCDIGSIYGAPADYIWGGGRVGCGDANSRAVLSLMREFGISARLTFSNSLLRKEHLSDSKCNALCELFSESNSPQNGVILLVIAFLVSPVGLPMAAAWLVSKVQDLRFAIQDAVYG